jgi:hypothetical protein
LSISEYGCSSKTMADDAPGDAPGVPRGEQQQQQQQQQPWAGGIAAAAAAGASWRITSGYVILHRPPQRCGED